jgi:hypothetical protein
MSSSNVIQERLCYIFQFLPIRNYETKVDATTERQRGKQYHG